MVKLFTDFQQRPLFGCHYFVLYEKSEIKHPFNILTTLLRNPKGPIELTNPNTCAEVKLAYFYIFRLKK